MCRNEDPKTAQEGARSDGPQGPQEGPMATQRAPQDGLRMRPYGPRAPSDGPRSPQEPPRRPQGAAKTPQQAPNNFSRGPQNLQEARNVTRVRQVTTTVPITRAHNTTHAGGLTTGGPPVQATLRVATLSAAFPHPPSCSCSLLPPPPPELLLPSPIVAHPGPSSSMGAASGWISG